MFLSLFRRQLHKDIGSFLRGICLFPPRLRLGDDLLLRSSLLILFEPEISFIIVSKIWKGKVLNKSKFTFMLITN